METNCKELEYIRDNILTEQNFDAMNTRYKRNPLLRFFRDINRCPGYRELSLIGKWLKALQGIPGLDKVEKNWDQFLLGHNIHSQTIRNKF